MIMRVEKTDARRQGIIRRSAEEMGWHIWNAHDASYLVPVVDPFVPESA